VTPPENSTVSIHTHSSRDAKRFPRRSRLSDLTEGEAAKNTKHAKKMPGDGTEIKIRLLQ
jgi:hypothetical protein